MNKSHETQVKKYGGVAGYRAEMKRRRSMVKSYAFKDNPKLAKEAVKKRWADNADSNTRPSTSPEK